jgi:hypothetical protein
MDDTVIEGCRQIAAGTRGRTMLRDQPISIQPERRRGAEVPREAGDEVEQSKQERSGE